MVYKCVLIYYDILTNNVIIYKILATKSKNGVSILVPAQWFPEFFRGVIYALHTIFRK